MVKQISWDVKTADMKYHATMTKKKGVSLRNKEGKETIKHFVGIMFSLCSWFCLLNNLWFTRNGSGIAFKPFWLAVSTIRYNANCTLNCVDIHWSKLKGIKCLNSQIFINEISISSKGKCNYWFWTLWIFQKHWNLFSFYKIKIYYIGFNYSLVTSKNECNLPFGNDSWT